MELPIAAYVILGMLRLGPLDVPEKGPRSGYDIQRSVDLSTRFFWNISPGQIYPALRQLEREGFVSGRSEPRGRRPRRVYELMSKGETALVEWLRRPELLPFELRDAATLKLFFADALEPQEALEHVHGMRVRSQQFVEGLRREGESFALVSLEKGDRFPLDTLRLGIAMHEAVVEFCAALERDLRASQRAHDETA